MLRLSHAIVFVGDMSRSVAFYRDLLGLSLRFESPEWSEFETGDTTLALHAAEAPSKPAHGPPPAGACHVGLTVDDLDAFHARLVAQGVRCVRPPKLEQFGAKLAVYLDPDGLGVSVSGPHGG